MLREKTLIKFLALSATLYVSWFGLYEFLLKPNGRLDDIITKNISYFMNVSLRATGYDVRFTPGEKLGETLFYQQPNPYPFLRVGASCNGLELLVLFTIFVLCYPGASRHKAWFIAGGNVLIHLLNIFRNYVLAIMSIHKSGYFDLFHRYIFIFMVYGGVFLLWMIWANKFSKLNVHDARKTE